jgi:penicillin-binding protein 2
MGLGLVAGQGWATVPQASAQKHKATRKSSSARKATSSNSKTTRATTTIATTKKTTTARRATPGNRPVRRRTTRSYTGQTWTANPYADSTAGDETAGEDPVVRAAVAQALGPLNGSIVVVDPNNGRILSMANQQLALGGGYTPCSTVKLPVAVAALREGLITKDKRVSLGRRWSMNLTDALARSNNSYFAKVGTEVGFPRLSKYARDFGFGELAGYGIAGEHLGTFPEAPPRVGGVGLLSSFGEEIHVTPLQLAAFVSAIANGGTLYYLQYPRSETEAASFQPRIKRELDIKDVLPQLREGMMAAVARGTARRLDDPYDTVAGKTGTCSEGGTRLGWFASYETPDNPRTVVVVLLRGGRSVMGPLAAQIAGRVYRNLHERGYFEQRPGANPITLNPAAAILGQ